jgi:hypothetical protein
MPKKGGRPSRGKVKVVVYFPPDIAEEVRRQAAAEFRPISEHVQFLVHLGMEARKQARKEE